MPAMIDHIFQFNIHIQYIQLTLSEYVDITLYIPITKQTGMPLSGRRFELSLRKYTLS